MSNNTSEQTIGERLEAFYKDHGEWSYATFGTPEVLGPQGPADHLVKEARELADNPRDEMEQADCFLLLLDVVRRSGGDVRSLLLAAENKLIINKSRKWNVTDPNKASEHVWNSAG